MKIKNFLFISILIISLILVLSPVNASEVALNQSTDNSNGILEIPYENTTNDDIYGGNVYDYGEHEDNDEYYDFHDDPTITDFVSGVFYGPYTEPALQFDQFEITAGEVNANDEVTINVTFDGTIFTNIFTLDRYPLRIQENDITIGKIPKENVSNLDYPTDWGRYSFNATFNYKLKEGTNELYVRFCGFLSNTLVFKKNTEPALINLNQNSIKIINKNSEYYSDSSWLNNEKSLKKALELVEDNGTVYLNNLEFFTNSKISIDKNITIIGNNTIINALEIPEMFEISSNVKLINITFKNASDYILKNNGNCTLENCIFTQTNGKTINNTGNLKIIDSIFKDINGVKSFNQMNTTLNTMTLIYNQNNIEIKNTTFTNITLPEHIELNGKIINSTYLIYNLNNSSLIIKDSNFNKTYTKIFYNQGNIIMKNTNITDTDITIPILKTTKMNKILNSFDLITSYLITWNPNTTTGPIDNFGILNISKCNIENTMWGGRKGSLSTLYFSDYAYFQTKNPYKIYGIKTNTASSYLTNTGGIINKGTLYIDGSTFKELESVFCGAIESEGTAVINNTTFYNCGGKNNGAILNKGTLNITNSLFNKTTGNKVIINKETLYFINSTITNSNTINIDNSGKLDVINSTFKDSSASNIIRTYEDSKSNIYNSIFTNIRASTSGIILNEGTMTFDKNIIDLRNYRPGGYEGTYGIYNNGNIQITHNLFLNTTTYAVDRWGNIQPNNHIFIKNEGGNLNANYNYFDTNSNPYDKYSTDPVGHYFILDIEPEYAALQIGEKTNFTATLKLDTGRYYEHYDLLQDITIEFTITNGTTKYVYYAPMTDGKATIEFNRSGLKGSYTIQAKLGYCTVEATVDIGKNYSQMDVKADEINYGENATFYMVVTGNLSHQPQGNVSVIIDGKKYSTKISNTRAEISISDLKPKTYDLVIRYEGDEDYFKSIKHMNYTVHKRPTNMTMTIPEIYYGELGIATITLRPDNAAIQAYMYITNEKNETTKKTIYLRNVTDIKLKNFAAGEYTITVVLWENLKYESSNATAIFKVNKFETNLTINATDINAGETEILNITLSPEGEVAGEAILQINNYTDIIFLKNGENSVTIENVTGGIYVVTATFPGDKKYASSSATCTFTARKLQTNMTAKIEDNTLYINTTPNSTGKVLIYINDDIYKVNLTNSQATFPINFTKAENYIFIYYLGDGYYNYTTCNLTYEYEGLLNLTGYDETFYNTENATYYATLTDEEGYGIANRTITLNVNNEVFEYITGTDGSITVPLNLAVGKYEITAQYRNKTAKNTITILEDAFITGNDTQAYTNVDFTYAVQLEDHNEKAIANAEITFKINSKTYTNKTNDKGIARITLNLKEGNYNITTQYRTATHSNNIYIGEILLKGNDLTIYNTETGIYQLNLTDKNGKGVANQTITITLNNKTYARTTDENGTTSLIIKLDTGKYTITAQFNDQKITNTITVLEDAFLSVNNTKAYENIDFTHIAKLTDHNGKAIANTELTFKFENKTYTNRTNDEGLAVLTLNLKEGNYTITSTYKNITKTAKIIIVDDSHLVGNDVKAYSGTDFRYKVKLTDHNNQAIADAEITFKINGKSFTNKTDINGETSLTLNLETGNYTIITSYKNHTITNNFEIIEDYILSGNDIKAYADTDFTYKVKLTDHNGKAIKNAELTFTVNGKTYNNKSDVNGQAIITLSLKTGNYEATARYRNTTTNNTLIIIEDYILTGNDIKAFTEEDFLYRVNLTDHNGKAIENAEITFEVNGKTYTNKTNNQGSAAITLNLKEGNYTITAKYRNATTTNGLEIIENHILTGQNIKAYENTDFTYTVTLKRTDGTLLTNKEITFIINNRKYTDTTNSEGKASKTLNLPEGNYTITAIYKNTRITNNLTIIKDYNLEGNNIRANSEKDFQYKVNLTDHNKKPVKNQEITFEINGKTFKNKTDANGQAAITLNLKKGNYTITTTYRNIKTTNKLEIVETYQLTGINVKSYENFDFEYIITLKNHNNKTIENAEITFIIGNDTYKNKTDNNGKAKLTLNLKKGNYTIKATYNNIQTTNKLEIIEYDLERIISSDIEMYYHDGTRFKIQILNQTVPLANKTVQIIINGKPYTRTTDDNGSASIGLNLNSGTYTVTTEYSILEKNNTITIKPTIKGNDLTKVFRNATQYYATFFNSKGELLKNTDVNFNINGVFYTRTTNENGTARMNINLQQGTYIITATNPQTKEQHTNIITVLSKIQENNDLTKYYRNASQYTLKIIDEKGNPAKTGQKVTFNINGVFYERYTNESGYVKMNINLQPGTYIITAEYEGCRVSNTIKVLPVLKAQDLTIKYRDGSKFKATLLDGKGKAYPNQQVTFNINGVLYTRNTDENGIAQLNINLMPGKYIITSSYNGLNIANTVKIE